MNFGKIPYLTPVKPTLYENSIFFAETELDNLRHILS